MIRIQLVCAAYLLHHRTTGAKPVSGEHPADPIPPEPHRLTAGVDTLFVQQILDVAQRQRVENVRHYCPGG